MAERPRFKVEHWLATDEVRRLRYADYWNDEDIERGKEWNVLDGDFARMERYVEETGLAGDLELCAATLSEVTGAGLRGVGVDLAAGNLWAAPHLLASGPVDLLYCVEFSEHRLLKIGPAVLDRYGVAPEQVVLAYGSFYELRLADSSVDFVFMSQALHHADHPGELLTEIDRVLKPDGGVLAIGEHIPTPRAHFGRFARGLLGRGQAGLGVDELAGDHFYSRRDYRRMFEAAGFSFRRLKRRESPYQAFVLWRGDGLS